MKNVQIGLDDSLLKTIDRLAAAYKLSRSAMVRKPLRSRIRRREIQEFEDTWIRKLKGNSDEITGSETWLQAEEWEDH